MELAHHPPPANLAAPEDGRTPDFVGSQPCPFFVAIRRFKSDTRPGGLFLWKKHGGLLALARSRRGTRASAAAPEAGALPSFLRVRMG
jgi:hypothetical protein